VVYLADSFVQRGEFHAGSFVEARDSAAAADPDGGGEMGVVVDLEVS
jgi:hypothetical protein